MDDRTRFFGEFKKIVEPLLRAEGFRGSGNTFQRINGAVIHVFNVQGSRYGGSCCINLGIHLDFLPTIGSPVSIKKVTESQCEFRSRLHEAGISDQWWSYGNSESDAEKSALSIADVFLGPGRDHFKQFRAFPGDFAGLSPDSFEKRSHEFNCFLTTKLRLLLTFARIQHHLENRDWTVGFANLGLAQIQGQAGIGLKAELKALASGLGSTP